MNAILVPNLVKLLNGSKLEQVMKINLALELPIQWLLMKANAIFLEDKMMIITSCVTCGSWICLLISLQNFQLNWIFAEEVDILLMFIMAKCMYSEASSNSQRN